jgi:FkbM family methyltransferase
MVLDFESLVEKYKIEIKGIIQVGAHFGQEMPLYNKLGVKNVVLFEPLKDVYKVLENNAKEFGYKTINVALSDKRGCAGMHREHKNQGQSSSLLEPYLHTKYYADIVFDSIELVEVETLDSFNITNCNVLNMDTQQSEDKVILGAKKTLKYIDFIYTEVNLEPLYKGGILLSELDNLLSTFSFKRVEIGQVNSGWTDALYIRNNG